ncbi:zinc finger MYM-type protein 1-like [Ambystoma mexicanum]|uniref:zinc finger MYM-type protein 1-like n=1 Tax=Ambystoma mexicanum TaxID=8296 RepID=UPI0037E7EED6
MYKEALVHGNVVHHMQTGSELQMKERRDYLLHIVAVIKLLGKQGISFRGHDESEDSENKGPFIEFLNVLSKFDPFLKRYIPPDNATYTSPSSQNEIIQCCSGEATHKIVNELKASGMYAIRGHHKEQLAICVRYVLPLSGEIKEHFLGFRELEDFNADAITESLQECLKEHGVDSILCVAQTYDGAAVMSGVSGGVQAKSRKYHPEGIYVHCYAHELNLVLCHTCKAIKEAKDFFSTMENLYTFFSTSLIHHHKFKAVQNTLGLKQGELVQLSDTCWSCQVRSVNALINNFPAVHQCLSEIESSTATGLLVKFKKTVSSILSLYVPVFAYPHRGLPHNPPKETLDLAKAVDLKDAVCNTLRAMQTPEKVSELLQKAESLLRDTSTEGEEIVLERRKKQKSMEDFVVEQSSSREHVSTKDDFRTKLFFPCLDGMISELENRFSSVSEEMMRGIQACSPLSPNFLSEDLREIAKHYNIDFKSEEALVANNYFANKKLNSQTLSMGQVYKLLDPLMFPTVTQIIQMALTVPVSSCSCERSFSALRRLHNWLRCTMGQSRLQDLAVLSVERGVLQSVSDDAIVDRFAGMHARRQALTVTRQNVK